MEIAFLICKSLLSSSSSFPFTRSRLSACVPTSLVISFWISIASVRSSTPHSSLSDNFLYSLIKDSISSASWVRASALSFDACACSFAACACSSDKEMSLEIPAVTAATAVATRINGFAISVAHNPFNAPESVAVAPAAVPSAVARPIEDKAAFASASLIPCAVKIAMRCSVVNALDDNTACNWLFDKLDVI